MPRSLSKLCLAGAPQNIWRVRRAGRTPQKKMLNPCKSSGDSSLAPIKQTPRWDLPPPGVWRVRFPKTALVVMVADLHCEHGPRKTMASLREVRGEQSRAPHVPCILPLYRASTFCDALTASFPNSTSSWLNLPLQGNGASCYRPLRPLEPLKAR